MFSVLYESSEGIEKLGTYATENEADEAAKQAQKDETFSIDDQRVYLMTPDHRLIEYDMDSLIDEDDE